MNLDWKLISLISAIDRFDASWSSIEKREGKSLKELKSIATVRSVGASTRIEGSGMSDQEVDALLRNLKIDKLVDRDSQEVAGYFAALDLVIKSFKDIPITLNSLKNLHNILLKHGEKDHWHRGDFKQHSNNVEAEFADGTKQVIFETTPPGFATDDAMRSMVEWYNSDNETHVIVKCALFSYELVSIHPFQDGNGRLSRLIATLLLLQDGYTWIQYVSFEHEIESRKTEYYRELRKCQTQRPHEDVSSWVYFFLDALRNIQLQLMDKLERSGASADLTPVDKSVLTYISEHPGAKSGEIEKSLQIAKSTVKRVLNKLLKLGFIERYGVGKGTNYSST